jgi:hypothetical protein
MQVPNTTTADLYHTQKLHRESSPYHIKHRSFWWNKMHSCRFRFLLYCASFVRNGFTIAQNDRAWVTQVWPNIFRYRLRRNQISKTTSQWSLPFPTAAVLIMCRVDNKSFQAYLICVPGSAFIRPTMERDQWQFALTLPVDTLGSFRTFPASSSNRLWRRGVKVSKRDKCSHCFDLIWLMWLWTTDCWWYSCDDY